MGKSAEWVNGPNRRYVLSAEDIPELEREAGVHEFVNKKPREEAEQNAYDSYRRKHHLEAAAHHLSMMRAAGASGSYNDAKKHKLVYDMHLQQLGYDPSDHNVPDDIKNFMNDPHNNPGLRFKAHKGDAFLLNKSEPLSPPVNEWEDWDNEYPSYNINALYGDMKKHEAKIIELRKSDSPLAINFMTNKLRQMRDMFDAHGQKTVNERDLEDDMRRRMIDMRVPRDYAGNFNRDSVQKLIEQAPTMNYNWSTGTFDRAVGATQRHSDELSNVLRMEITPEIERKLKDAGVWDSYMAMQRLSHGSGHPSNDHTAGWIRYTGDKSGVHLDELQSDFGRPWPGMLAEAARRGDFGDVIPEHEIPGWIDSISRQHHLEEDKRKLIQKILFGNKHPGEFLHEAFNAWARGPGELTGAPVHVWQPEAKLWIANRDEDPRGHFNQSRPIPGHMQVTYRDVPVKRGMAEGKYGEIPTQTNPKLKRAPAKKKVVAGKVGEDILWRPSNKTYKDVVRGEKETPPSKEEVKKKVLEMAKRVLDPNQIKTRDEGIRRSKLPPGAPGADKAGVGVQTDKRKEADKNAARKWKPGKEE